MAHHRWSGIFTSVIMIAGCIFIFSGCAKQTAKDAVFERQSDVKQGEARVEARGEAGEEANRETQVEVRGEARREIIAEARGELRREAQRKAKGEVRGEVRGEARKEAKETTRKKAEHKTQYVVKKGDCLWWIARYKDKYNNPKLWPLIYKANKRIIKNPNLIYPGQKFIIPIEGYSPDTIGKEKKKSGVTRHYAPPKHAYLKIN